MDILENDLDVLEVTAAPSVPAQVSAALSEIHSSVTRFFEARMKEVVPIRTDTGYRKATAFVGGSGTVRVHLEERGINGGVTYAMQSTYPGQNAENAFAFQVDPPRCVVSGFDRQMGDSLESPEAFLTLRNTPLWMMSEADTGSL